MKLSKSKITLFIVLAVVLMGILVLIFKEDYSIEKNLQTNKNYYQFLGKE